MTYESIKKGLNEAIKINKNELKGRKQKNEISPDKKNSHISHSN